MSTRQSDPQHPPGSQQQQGSQQLQRGHSHSVWLAPERFEAADFSPDQCVAELRRYVPLPTVKAELQTHLVRLKNQLVEALNEDYSDYVGLSGQLSGLEGAVVRMRQPLLEIQAKLSSVQDSLKAELHSLEQGLQRRSDAAAARATLELMQEVAASTSKVEKLLSELNSSQHTAAAGAAAAGSAAVPSAAAAGNAATEGGSAAGGDELEERCRMLLRVAGEAARLMFLADRGKHLAFVKSLERRVDGARFALNRQLQAALASALSAHAWGPAGNCLRGFLELAEPTHAEEGLRQHLTGPLVRQVVTEVRQQQLQGQAAGGGATSNGSSSTANSSSPLSQVVAISLSRLRQQAGALLTQLTAPGSGLGGIDFLGAVLLTELSTAVADGLPGLFSPGNPTAFQCNYLAGQALLCELEGLATSRAAVERLRASTAAAGWAKRWNLPVYFSLVYQDIAGTFEAAASASQLSPAADAKLTAPLPPLQHSAQPELHFAVSTCLWGCLQRTLAPNVFLLQLGDKFSRLMTQLLVRYDTWLQDVVRIRQEAAGAGAASQQQQGQPPMQQQQQQHQPQQQQAAVGGAGAGAGAAGVGREGRSGPAAWVPDMPLDSVALICADADLIKTVLQGPFVDQLQQRLEGLPADVVGQLVVLVQGLAERIGQHGQQVLLLLAVDVLEHCVASVRQLKGITATYRMTAKGPPVRHSHYVAGVFQPLRLLLERAPVATLPQHLKLLLSRDVIDAVNGRYTALAEELLTSVKKTESSLKRLKKTRPGEAPGEAGTAGAAMSDSDKIGMQLLLDVQEHGRQIDRFGLVAQELESYKQLLATVAPADKQQEQQPEQQQQVAA